MSIWLEEGIFFFFFFTSSVLVAFGRDVGDAGLSLSASWKGTSVGRGGDEGMGKEARMDGRMDGWMRVWGQASEMWVYVVQWTSPTS